MMLTTSQIILILIGAGTIASWMTRILVWLDTPSSGRR